MLSQNVLTQLLFYYPVLHELPGNLQHQLLESAVPTQLPRRHILFREGDPCQNFFMLLAGTVRVVRPDVSGREILLYRLRPNDVCILTVSGLLGNQPYPAWGVVDRPVTAVSLPRPLFIDLITQSATFRTFTFASFERRLSDLFRLIEQVTFQKLDQRLAALLLQRGPALFTTHQQLADELGTAREVISRLLHEFRERGAILLERGRILVIEESGLRQTAEPECDFSH
ncbi:MAG: Crp/Fnr family transcriptional regulator [Anaerolineales bacterium]|nr:Crp/Fnr family transcriptional regulator [Anaerolineales bacterium]MCB0014927.1 Crp/Fnr family transcriptional regulator [Anaerolineales bacterium]